jgi:hypothetical protein
MVKGMARGGLGDARGTDCVLHDTLKNGFVQMMPAPLAREAVQVEPRGRKDPLPRPVAPGVWILPQEGPG